MIGLNKPKSKTRIVVAMSGGVDSSTVAAMLVEEGYEVIGITLQLYDHGVMISKKGACCAGQDIYDAKMVADKLKIPHYVLDFESKFKKSVIDDFVDSYVRGETPLPCVRCNQEVKFNDLLKIAQDLDADGLATGHYVQKVNTKNGPELHSGLDPRKDQSYFLFTLTKKQLDYLWFPLGSLTKDQTRLAASSYGLINANKPDSQDICFVPNGNYREIVTKFYKDSGKKGKIIHVDGVVLGEHSGIINYTIGQRKGIGLAAKTPLYVTKIDPINNIVYVGEQHHLKSSKFIIKEVNWLAETLSQNEELEVNVKIRSTKPHSSAIIKFINNNNIEVKLSIEDIAITPGQACVIYDRQRVLGGGWITREIY